MAENEKNETPQPRSRAAQPQAPTAERQKGDQSGAGLDRARTSGARSGGVGERQQEEYASAGINPALDNRTGDQRPTKRGFAAKPQQYPGPEVGHFAEHADGLRGEFEEAFGGGDEPAERAHTGGPHGRGDRDGPSYAGPDGNPGSV